MELAVAILALAGAAGALVLAWRVRGELAQVRARLSQPAVEPPTTPADDGAHDGLHAEIVDLRRELEQATRGLGELKTELNELKAAAESAPAPPPLPRARASRLDDLREQLRAAHRAPDAEE